MSPGPYASVFGSAVGILGWMLVWPGPALGGATVAYTLTYPTPGAERVSVRIDLEDPAPGSKILVIPRAIPMGYGEQPFDRFIENLHASGPDGGSLPVSREEGPRWLVGGGDAVVARIDYQVNIRLMEQEIYSAADTSKVRHGYLGLLGYSVFAFVEGLEEHPIQIEVEVPENWPVLTTLAPRAPPSKGTTQAVAPNFYSLADSQVVAGPDVRIHRLQGGVPLFLALYAEGNVSLALVGNLAQTAMEQVIAYFGSAPFPHYTVHQELLKPVSAHHEYGFSMEHLESATFYLGKDRGITESSPPQETARTVYNFAHHFAHAWIPKRAYPKGYYPFTWEMAPVLDTIWFSEGFPQYAAIEALAASLPEEEGRRYRESMLEQRFRQNVESAPRFIQKMSAIELSRVASTRYSEDFRTGRNTFSRGGLMAAEMDDRIRKETGRTKSLRDAFRHLVAWSLEHQKPFEIDSLPLIFQEATGVDTRDILERWLKPLAN